MALRLLQTDCVGFMNGCADGEFDLAIVDPPYGIKVNMNMGRRKGKRKKREDKDWDSAIPTMEYFDELARVSKNQIIWGGNYFPHLPIYNPKAKRLTDFESLISAGGGILWDKGETMYGRDFSEGEIAYSTVGNGRIKINPNQLLRFHPTQKPVKLYEYLLHTFAKPGWKIFDSHGGSMNIAVACHRLGFDLTLTEIDPDYYAQGMRNVHQQKLQLSIF